MGNLREHELHAANVAQLGFIPGACHYAALGSGVPYGFLRDNRRVPASRLHLSIVDAYDAAGRQNGNNNVVFVTPDSHTQAVALSLDKNMTHLVGMYPQMPMNQRSRIGHSVTVSPMLTLSGYGNLLKNLYFMHGIAATDLIGMQITGERNMLENVHIGGPMAALQSAEATYATLDLVGASECYFKDCTFGTDTIARTDSNCVLRIGAGAVRNVFENCTFLMHSSVGDSYFIEVVVGSTFSWTLFKNCQFITIYGTAAAVGILNSSVAYGHKLLFDSRCAMFGATDAIAAAGEASVLQGNGGYCAADENILLSTAFDHTV
jgi:hypothetical protein